MKLTWKWYFLMALQFAYLLSSSVPEFNTHTPTTEVYLYYLMYIMVL